MNTELKNNLKSFLDRLINASQDGTIHPELFEADADTLRAAITLEAENARLREELAAAQATIEQMRDALNKVRADAVAEYVAATTANQHTHQCRRCLNPYTALSENEDCPFCGCTDAEAKAILAQRIEQEQCE